MIRWDKSDVFVTAFLGESCVSPTRTCYITNSNCNGSICVCNTGYSRSGSVCVITPGKIACVTLKTYS
jgi:hypothetical protein